MKVGRVLLFALAAVAVGGGAWAAYRILAGRTTPTLAPDAPAVGASRVVVDEAERADVLHVDYADAVVRAGGVPLLLPPSIDSVL